MASGSKRSRGIRTPRRSEKTLDKNGQPLKKGAKLLPLGEGHQKGNYGRGFSAIARKIRGKGKTKVDRREKKYDPGNGHCKVA
jgi:hypothetical protein